LWLTGKLGPFAQVGAQISFNDSPQILPEVNAWVVAQGRQLSNVEE